MKTTRLSVRLGLVVIMVSLLTTACGGRSVPTAAPAAMPNPQMPAWDALVLAAEKEGTVSVYGPPGAEIRKEVTEAWGSAFPKVTLEYTGVSGQQIFQKVRSEVESGVGGADIIFNGTSQAVQRLKPDGILEGPIDSWIIHPDALRQDAWIGGKGPLWIDKDKYLIAMASQIGSALVYNKDQVAASELTGDADLLNPKWRGKIITTNPFVGGAGSAPFEIAYSLHGEDYLRRLATQNITMTDDQRQVVDWVVQGRYSIGLGASPAVVRTFLDQEVKNLGVVTDRNWSDQLGVGWGFAALWVPKNPHHPNAAKLFANWILTKEGQEAAVVRGLGYASARVDLADLVKQSMYEFQIPDPNKQHACTLCEDFMTGPIPDEVERILRDARFGQ